jgi:hypothetical protein
MPTPIATTSIAMTTLPPSAATASPPASPAPSTVPNGSPTAAAIAQPQPRTNAALKTDTWGRCYRALRMSCAAALAIMGMVAAYWTLMVTWWTAEKDFRDDCRSQIATVGHASPACLKELGKDLQAPPIPIDFHDKRGEIYSRFESKGIWPLPEKWFPSQSEHTYGVLLRPKPSCMTVAILTITCLLCPVAYWYLRSYLLRSHKAQTGKHLV